MFLYYGKNQESKVISNIIGYIDKKYITFYRKFILQTKTLSKGGVDRIVYIL